MKRILILFMIVILLSSCSKRDEKTLTIITTTSLDNSMLLKSIIPVFEEEYDCQVLVVALGTGAALEMGKLKQGDILLVHDKTREIQFISDGYGVKRKQIMYNDFIFIGPEKPEVSNLFEMLTFLNTGNDFYSRGDNSGTHSKELSLWTSEGFDISTFGDWYKETGQGMGDTISAAENKNSYTFTDRGTYLYRKSLGLSLEISYENTEELINEYGVILVEGIDNPLAEEFYDWITSDQALDLIEEYKYYGEQLFLTYRGD